MKRASRNALWAMVGIVIVGGLIAVHLLVGPEPVAFAGGKRVALAEYQAADPTGVPEELKSASLIQRGEYLTRAADCVVCHTAQGGVAFAGGRAFVLPFGTMYSTNITADPQTGIGSYTDSNFLDALRKGIGRGNSKLYPAMPYASYTYMSDADVLAIKAYLFSLKPVHAPAPENTLRFPFNQRSLMRVWSVMFNPDKRYEPNLDQSPQWNRGAYLVEAMAHCGECHTPRNLLFALDNRRKFAGEIQAGWRAYNITPDHGTGVGAWSDAQLAQYLSQGHADGRGTASGPMGEAVDESLSHLTAPDIAAMVTYLKTVPPMTSPDLPPPRAELASTSFALEGYPHGKTIYEGACAGCHGWTGDSPVLPAASLTGTRSVNDPTARNVAQIIIRGSQRHSARDATHMPGFGSTYSDAEIAGVANYVTARFGVKGAHLSGKNIAAMRTED